MINIKKKIFFAIKSVLALFALLIVVLFFYAAFFFEPLNIKKQETEKRIVENEEVSNTKEEKKIDESSVKQKKKTKQIKTLIQDGLYATVGNKAITKSDIINEIKLILILSNKNFSEDKREQLQQMAIKSIIKRNIKKIEIEKNNYLQFNQEDLQRELLKTSNHINIDINELQNIFSSNDLNFSILEDRIKTDLLWNSLIFQLYKNRISINLDEIEEQLKLIQNKKEIEEYLISEIVIKSVEKDKLESTIKELNNKIKMEGFESAAVSLSISNSAARGGDLGWINENVISKKLLSVISKTPVGNISNPIVLPNGILIFKVRNRRVVEKNINLEETKNALVNAEKERILNMHSSSHYNNLRRTVSIKFF